MQVLMLHSLRGESLQSNVEEGQPPEATVPLLRLKGLDVRGDS